MYQICASRAVQFVLNVQTLHKTVLHRRVLKTISSSTTVASSTVQTDTMRIHLQDNVLLVQLDAAPALHREHLHAQFAARATTFK